MGLSWLLLAEVLGPADADAPDVLASPAVRSWAASGCCCCCGAAAAAAVAGASSIFWFAAGWFASGVADDGRKLNQQCLKDGKQKTTKTKTNDLARSQKNFFCFCTHHPSNIFHTYT